MCAVAGACVATSNFMLSCAMQNAGLTRTLPVRGSVYEGGAAGLASFLRRLFAWHSETVLVFFFVAP